MLKKFNYTTRTLLVLLITFAFYDHFSKSNYDITVGPYSVLINASFIIIITFLPAILEKINIKISNGLYYFIISSFMTGLIGGVVFKLYRKLKYVDTLVHFANGALITIIAFSLIKLEVQNWSKHIVVILVVSVMFSITIGTIWEIYEFVADLLTDGNMQRYRDVVTEIDFVGQKALVDTMRDIIVDTLGAILASSVLYLSNLKSKRIINSLSLEYIDNK
ncbi:hypothetical protein [Haploplasma axanthum]|uniref:Predicted membrane protein n=1 Tax=Haploplasma axanthum TaxID=29552 RepID=A0A449BD24_HAPAX|nr:hypothetical protein [Haploplasma axanthum]VEU80336.1 Predicted membrane protein [Haploplasma axanthum]